jgi:hypothetical protein
MDFATKLKIAAGKRRAKRGGINPPPIGTWERVGWDEWQGDLEWERRVREEHASEAHITTGYFTPIRTAASKAHLSSSAGFAPVRRIAVAISSCASLYLAGRYLLHWI